MESFIGKRMEQGILTKEKEGLFWAGTFAGGVGRKKRGRIFTVQIASSFFVGWRGLLKDYRTVLDQEIPG